MPETIAIGRCQSKVAVIVHEIVVGFGALSACRTTLTEPALTSNVAFGSDVLGSAPAARRAGYTAAPKATHWYLPWIRDAVRARGIRWGRPTREGHQPASGTSGVPTGDFSLVVIRAQADGVQYRGPGGAARRQRRHHRVWPARDHLRRQCCVDGSWRAGDWFGDVVGKAGARSSLHQEAAGHAPYGVSPQGPPTSHKMPINDLGRARHQREPRPVGPHRLVRASLAITACTTGPDQAAATAAMV